HLEVLREAHFVARETAAAAEAVAADLLRVARAGYAIVADRLEKFWLESEREHMDRTALLFECFHRRDDFTAACLALAFARARDRRDFRYRRRILLERAARHNPLARIYRDDVIVDRERDLFGCAAQH